MSRYSLPAILGLALVLRVALALQGGQFFFPDESRFLRGVLLYRSLASGHWDLAAQAFSTSQHAGFPLIAALVAAPAHLLASLAGTGDWSQAIQVRASLPLIAAVFSLFSVLNVWLVHRLALVSGGTKSEADLSALLAAVSGSLFYYARHLLPYDCALTAILAGLVLAATAQTAARALAAGFCAGVSVAIYNGYWFLAPVVGLALLFRAAPWRERLRFATLGAIGGVLGLAAMMLPAVLVRGTAFWSDLTQFSGSVTQGLFAEGWSLPAEYLWHAEGTLGLVVLLTVSASLPALFAPGFSPARIRLWLGLAGFIYVLLFICSTVLEKFVVYGRSVRPLSVLLCLLGGWALERLLQKRPQWRPAAVVVLLALAALNLAPHFRLTFPNDAKLTVWSQYGAPKLVSTFSGLSIDPQWPPTTRPDLAFVNPLTLYPIRDYVPAPAGRVLAEWHHPQSLAVYRYEGHTPRERRLLAAHPPLIQLLALAEPAAVPDQPPLEFFLRKSELSDGYDRGRH